ncbi:MAG: hypothetical protein KGL26_02945 [Pseudomonadota bacterium]|nr:hypothetical protein [Pseudomonadota bacterium]
MTQQTAAHATIEIRVDEITQLFNTLDPVPFHERDLDQDAEEFIVGWARELPHNRPLRLVIHLPKREAESDKAAKLEDALSRYFSYRAEMVSRDLSEMFRVGRLSLAIGLSVLAVCTLARAVLYQSTVERDLGGFVGEGLLILGWVANWRPIEIFLYSWWPLARTRNLYRRLAAAKVVLEADARPAR